MARIDTDCRLNQTDYEHVALGTTNVADDGCAVCCLAMHLLSRLSDTITDELKEDVVTIIAGSGFFNDAGEIYLPPQSQSVTVDGTSYTIGYSKTADIAARILEGKTGFVQFMATLPKGTFVSHYVFVDGIDTTESDPLRKLLVVDPSDGESKTLYEAMVDRYAFEKDDNGRPLTPSTTQLNSNFKCVFS